MPDGLWSEGQPYQYSNERRNDPELKGKVRKVVERRQKAMEQADDLLREARHIMQDAALFVDDVVFMRQLEQISRTSFSLTEDTQFERDVFSETYIENLAAGRLGEEIEKMGDQFPL
jgi:hypothetical protein